MNETIFFVILSSTLLVIGTQIFLYLQSETATRKDKWIANSLSLLGICLLTVALLSIPLTPQQMALYALAANGLKSVTGFHFPWEPAIIAKREFKKRVEVLPGISADEKLKLLEGLEKF